MEKSSENPSNIHAGEGSNLMLVAPGKGLEPLRAKGPLANLSMAQPTFCFRGSRGQRDNHSATPARIEGLCFCHKTFSVSPRLNTFGLLQAMHTETYRGLSQHACRLILDNEVCQIHAVLVNLPQKRSHSQNLRHHLKRLILRSTLNFRKHKLNSFMHTTYTLS